MRLVGLFILLGFALRGLVACSVGCDDKQAYAFDITVVDGRTGAPLCDAEVLVFKDDDLQRVSGTYVDDDCRYVVGRDEAGSYTVAVVRTGYATDTRRIDVEEDEDSCHVRTASYEVVLVPTS